MNGLLTMWEMFVWRQLVMSKKPMKTPDEDEPDFPVPKPVDFVPEWTFPLGHRWAGKPRCHAWSRRQGRQCERIPTRGKRVCRSHGGAGGRPPEHGRFAIPAKLLDAYIRATGDPSAMEQWQHIAVVDARIDELLAMTETDDPGPDAASISKALRLVQKGIRSGDIECCRRGADEIERALEPSRRDRAIWAEIRENLRVRDSLWRTRQKWLRDNRQVVSVAEFLEFIKTMHVLTWKYIRDPKDRQALIEELKRYLPRP
jgi:hypothetical protein